MTVGAYEADLRIDRALAGGETTLDLSNLQLGKLPERLAEVESLTKLDLDGNYLRELPDWLAALPLTELNLGRNRLRRLPDSMSGLTSLRRLEIDENRLSELPRWLSNMDMRELFIDSNPLSTLPDWIGSMTGLTTLRIGTCRLSSVPEWLASLKRLTHIDLDGNRLTELPDWLADLTELTKLRLHGNRLTDLPRWLGDLPLTELDIDDNRLDTPPDWIGAITTLTKLGLGKLRLPMVPDWVRGLTRLTRLDLDDNQIEKLPGWMSELTQLTSLVVDGNQLIELPALPPGVTSLGLDGNRFATLPEQLAEMTDLTRLGIGHCSLGKVPGWVRTLTSLKTLHLHENQIESLPNWLGELGELRILWLNDNRLVKLPECLRKLKLTHLYVDSNPFHELPEWLGEMSTLSALGIGSCRLAEFPSWLENLDGLNLLWLHNNKLRKLPPRFPNLPNISTLRLEKNELQEIPDWLGEISDLRSLYLDENPLKEVPSCIAKLQALTYLGLTECQLRKLPGWFSSLKQLRRLYLTSNELSALPSNFTKLHHLSHLHLSENQLASLPAALGSLQDLILLSVNDNRLTDLPTSIGGLTSLRTLQLSDNQLKNLGPDIGRLAELTHLTLSKNTLTALPDTIGKLHRLETLNVSGNRIESLPESIGEIKRIKTLQLADNELHALPDCLVDLPRLTELAVTGNPLISPPPEITAGGSRSVLDFLRERAIGSAAQWLSKLLIVGEGGIGKTSLVKALAKDTHDPDEPSTHGLLIRDLTLDHPDRDGTRMQLSTWDFGGQQIYHATHQFFLTNRSLFVLLWNSRLGWEQGKLHYWLDIITARAPESPIVLVATHIHGRPVDLPLTELRSKYPRIVDSRQVDNASRQGIAELRELLARQAAQLPLMGSEWPSTWLTAADAVRAIPDNHVTPSHMWDVMTAAGVADSQRHSFIARALHELGDILYYSDDPELSEIVVLRPAWVNDYISRVLDSGEVAARHGLLTRQHLNELWRDLDKGVRDHFLSMMDKYDLSYRVDGSQTGDVSLVVERLQWDPPAYEQEWEAARRQVGCREIKVIYQLNTTPPGIPTWFIARSHRFSRDTHWRTGALLAHGDGSHLALISADRQRNRVELAVRGPAPVGFFMVLDDGLNLTLERFPGLHITRRVPCRCAEGCPELFDYDNLQARLSRTPPRYEIECHRSGESVSVPELVLGLAPSERDTTGKSIERLARTLDQLGDRLEEHSDFSQRMFLRLQRLAQQQQEARCPSVFAVVPTRRARVTGAAYEIHLYCEEPGSWHRLPDPLGNYPITQPREWFAKLGPYLGHLVRVLKHAAPLAGPVLGITVDVLSQQTKADCDLMKELIAQLPKDIDHDRSLPGGSSPDSRPDLRANTDADFRALKAMLTKLDPDEAWGGLSRFDTPEGLTLYLCEEHLAQYRTPSTSDGRVETSAERIP